MKSKKLIAGGLSVVAASLVVGSWSQDALAAGPVAVAPGEARSMTIGQPSSPVSFSLALGGGYLTGESKELVYWPEFGNHKASELTWKIDSLFMVGLGGTLKVQDWLAVNFKGWFKATDGEGSMDDYDWAVVGGDWTDYSHSENTDVTKGSMIDLDVEFSFVRTEVLALKAMLGYKRDNFGWEAYGADYTYSVNGTRDTTGSISDSTAVIGYEQTFTAPYVGLGFEAKFHTFELNSRVIYSPLAQGDATDNHYLRNLVTYDDGDDGDMVAVDITGIFWVAEHFSVELGYSYQKYDMMQGDSEWEYRDRGYSYIYTDGAGMDQTSSLISLALRYTF